MSAKEQPYIITERPVISLEVIKEYNPNYGDDRICGTVIESEFGMKAFCGHHYYRHFDGYEDMRAVGCKYCECRDFTEK